MTGEKQYRVLHVFSAYGGGISSLILNLLENTTGNLTFDTLAFSYRKGESFVETVEKQGGKCYTMCSARKEGIQSCWKSIESLFKRQKYDAVHCHIAGWMSLPFWYAAKKNGIRVFVIHAHTTRYDSKIDRIPIIQKLNKIINYKCASHYMICSDMAGEYIFGEKYISKKNTELIPNGIQEEKFLSVITDVEIDQYNREFSILKNEKIVAHVGRFSVPKNHDFILEIGKFLKQKQANCVILLIGDGELFEEIRDKATEMQLLDYIKFLGRRYDISKLMQYADKMILPSINEGLPTVAVECQASGTPILVANTITKQCDMNIGLVEFLSLESPEQWGEKILSNGVKKLKQEESISYIREKGFTAKKAGAMYCNMMLRYIEGSKEK